VLVLVDEWDYATFRRVSHAAFEAGLQRDRLLIPLVMAESEWQRDVDDEVLLARDIAAEGVLL
jgi:hypothetical protein